jgi:hypothetical protein
MGKPKMNEDPSLEDRRTTREPVAMRAQCRTVHGRSGEVVITDLTASGCCIFAKGVLPRAGVAVRIRPENFEAIAGVVRWARDGQAGIEFDRPLYGPVAEHLQRVFEATA